MILRRCALAAVLTLVPAAPAAAAERPWIAMCQPAGGGDLNRDVDLYRIDAAGRSDRLTIGASVAGMVAGGGTAVFASPGRDAPTEFVRNEPYLARDGQTRPLTLPRFRFPAAMRADGRLLAYEARRADDRGDELLTVRLDRPGARPTRVARITGPEIWASEFDARGQLWAAIPRTRGRSTEVRRLTGGRRGFFDRTRPFRLEVGRDRIALAARGRVVVRTVSGRFVAQLKGAVLETWSVTDRTLLVRVDGGKTVAAWTPATGTLVRWAPTPCGTPFRLQPAG